jgi:DNA repair protein RadC
MEAVHNTVTELSVSYINKQKATDRPKVSSTSDGFFCIRDAFDMDTIYIQEQFVVAYLNQAGRLLGLYKVSKGGISGTVVDVRLILSVALKICATSLIIAHNHPSGSLKPSREDDQLTNKIREAAKFMEIRLLDHLIIHPNGTEYFSFADEGLI